VAVVVIVASVLVRRVAWRAWAILVVWIALADVLPLVIAGCTRSPPACSRSKRAMSRRDAGADGMPRIGLPSAGDRAAAPG